MTDGSSVSLFGISIANTSYEALLDAINKAIRQKQKITITYANQNSLNIVYQHPETAAVFNSIRIVHPDGTGIHLASGFLYGNKGLAKRLTGSDLYSLILTNCCETGAKIFFFGDTEATLSHVKIRFSNSLFAGAVSGFNFNTEEVLRQITAAQPDIVMVGLGSPLQEQWIAQNAARIDAPVIIAVGEGIRIAAGTKRRGPLWMQKAGLEWLVRLCFDPGRLWKRYCIGIPVFMYRIIKEKLNLR